MKDLMVEERRHVRRYMKQGNDVDTEQQMVFAGEIDRMAVKLHEGYAELDGRITGEIGKGLHEAPLLSRKLRTNDAGKRHETLGTQ